MAKPRSDLATIASVAQMLAVVLTLTALYFARDVFIPLALGLLLSFLLSPVVDRLQRLGVPNVIAVVATASLAFVLLAGLFTLFGRELTTLIGDLPTHREELVTKARSFAGMTTDVGGSLDELAEDMSEAMEKPAEPRRDVGEATAWKEWTDRLLPNEFKVREESANDGKTADSPLFVRSVKKDLPLASWAAFAGTVLGPLATAGLVSVFALFMLVHRDDLRDRIIAVISHGNYVTTTEALDEAASRISRYLVAQTIINTTFGIVLSIGLVVIGATMTEGGEFPNAILWGLLATCLRFVPFIGPTVSAIFPLGIALSVFPGYGVAFAVLGLIAILELLSNNILEPWLYGASTGISAVAVVIAAVFWGWLWGPVGLLLSTPLTVCLVVLGRYVPRFKILATLLGEEVEIKTSMRFYQRLLAADARRAWEILRDQLDKGKNVSAITDEVLIPTLKRIRNDHDAEQLSDVDESRLLAMVGGSIEKLNEHIGANVTSQADSRLPLIVGCSSHHFSETLVLNLLRTPGHEQYELQAIDDESLPAETARCITDSRPAVVVIVVLPKGGFAQARYLCKTIREYGFTDPIVLACLGKFKNFDKLFVRFRKAGATSVTTSFSQTQMKIESILSRKDAVVTRSNQNPEVFVETNA